MAKAEKRQIIRDPIHGFIRLTDQERLIIDSPEFQRLRGVKQLGLTDLVYPSATHTRFAHSIGSMHVAGLIAQQVGLSKDQYRLARLCLLLHDIGHGPFSHLFDVICKVAAESAYEHEAIGRQIVHDSTEIQAALGADAPTVEEELLGKRRSVIHDIVSGGLDADKLDYLRRDSHFAGVNYGRFDFERILWTLETDGLHIVVLEKGMDSIEGLRLARQQMWVQVYTHHARLIADNMMCRLVEMNCRGNQERKDRLKFDDVTHSAFRVLSLDDHRFLQSLEVEVNGEARELLDRLSARHLLKRALDSRVEDIPIDARSDILSRKLKTEQIEDEIAQISGVPRHLVFAVIPRVDMKQYHGLAGGEPLLIKPENGGDLIDFGRLEGIRVGDENPRRLYIFGPLEAKAKLREASIQYLGNYH